MTPTKKTVKVNESALDMFAKYGVKSIQKGSTEIKLVKSKKKMVKNIKKQTVYLPVKIDDEFWTKWDNGEKPDYDLSNVETGENIESWVNEKEGYFFTPEQLNEYTRNVIEQALETAAEKIVSDALETCGSSVPDCWNKESITNTLEETCKKFEV